MTTTGQRQEQGAAAIWAVFMATAVLAIAGLVIDGGYTMAAKREAARAAEQAARAGADGIDTTSLRTGTVRLDPAAATRAADTYLTSVGETGTVDVATDTVTVTVTKHHRSVILSAFGSDGFTVQASATASTIDSPDPATATGPIPGREP